MRAIAAASSGLALRGVSPSAFCRAMPIMAFGERRQSRGGRAAHEHGELLATIPPDDIPRAHHLEHAMGDGTKREIAHGVAVVVVDSLEVIQIEHQKTEPRAERRVRELALE